MQQPDKDNVDSIHLEGARLEPTDGKKTKATDSDAVDPLPSKKKPTAKDAAAQFLKDTDRTVVVTPDDNARILRKIDLRILPIILFVYCLQSLDKTTLSYASVFGLIEDTNLVGDQFSWLGSVVYLAQLVFQPLVAYSLVKFPIGKFCAVMVLCWGAVLCGMTAAHNFTGLLVARLLLGAFEASVGES